MAVRGARSGCASPAGVKIMRIPDLPPSIAFVPLPESEEAIRFAFDVKRAALGPCIAQRWGWDEDRQERVHRTRFAEKPFAKIIEAGCPIGTVSLMDGGGFLRFGEFYLLPHCQGRGVGTRILRHCLSLADRHRLPVRLEHLKWNPVGALYRRHGFVVTGETEIHWLMERRPEA